jgi:type IV pilus assembly protein PilW
MTLIELMVGIAIGLVLVAGLSTLFANSSQSANELDKSIRQLENGRYAVDLLSEDLMHAGFYGDVLSVSGPPTYVSPDPCATALANLGWTAPVSPAAATVPTAVAGLSSVQVDALTCLPNHKVNTPGIALRRLDTTAIAPATAASGSVYVQSSSCSTAADTFVVASAVTASIATTFNLQTKACDALNPAPMRRHISRVYYIASCNECGIDTTPTLKRAELVGNQIIVMPMVEGIDDMAFEYGFDTAMAGNPALFDGIPDEYRTGLSGVVGANNNDWKNVVSVRTYLLTRSTEATPGYTENKTYSMGLGGTRGVFADAFKRRVYAITTRLNNVASQREGS